MTSRDVRSRYRVLLIEDHELLAEATAAFLRRYGLDVTIASTGQQALATALAFKPEIVLCDARLPDMHGLEVARTLRTMPGGSNLVIAVHTAMIGHSPSALSGPAADVVDRIVPKPITVEALDNLVSRLESKGLDGDRIA